MGNELGLRLDVKYNRIYIHRATLKAIGNPEFVALGIHPQSRKLVVLPSAADTPDAIGIRTVAPQLDQPRSYLLRGKLLTGQPAVSFDMNEAETIKEAE